LGRLPANSGRAGLGEIDRAPQYRPTGSISVLPGIDYDQRVANVRQAINGHAAFDAAWQDGRAMTLDEAVDHAVR